MTHPVSSPKRPRPQATTQHGVTLVELLVALVISGLFLPLIWSGIHGAIRFFEATLWQVQLERDLNRVSTLLDAEAEDACMFGTNAPPPACAAAAPVCAAAANQLRMRVTLLDANFVPTGADAVILYTRNTATNELLRSGPQILANGQLSPANTASNDQLVMRGVTGFAVTPNNDCDTATVVITAVPVAPNTSTAAQGFGNPVTRTIGLRTGSKSYVD